jgi:hypothetical protein
MFKNIALLREGNPKKKIQKNNTRKRIWANGPIGMKVVTLILVECGQLVESPITPRLHAILYKSHHLSPNSISQPTLVA